MAPNAPSAEPVITLSIDSLKTGDEKGKNGEVIPEKASFNSSKVMNFLKSRGITANTMEKSFNLDVGMALTSENPTANEKNINNKFNSAKLVLDRYQQQDIMLERSEDVVQSKINSLETPPTNMTETEAGSVLQAFRYLSVIRDYCKRLLTAETKIKNDMEEEKKGVGFMASIQEKLGDAKDNWDKWDASKKMAFAGIALVGAIWLLKSENETVKKIKGYMKTGLGIAGGAWLLNAGVEMFTGHSLVEHVTDRTKGSTQQAMFFVENFQTDEEGAQKLSHSFVAMSDVKFMDLLDKYEAAKADNSHKIDGYKMKPEDAYKALDIFTRKYNTTELRKQYEKNTPPISYSQVAADQMARDPSIKMADNIATRVYDATADKFSESYNYMASTGPSLWLGKKYRDWFGKDPNKLEMDDFVKKFNNVVKDEPGFVSAVETNLAARDVEAGKQFIDTVKTGTPDTKYGLKFKQSGNYLYVVTERPIGTAQISDNKFVSNTIQASVSESEAFLANKYSKNMADVPKYTEVFGSVYITSSSTMRYLVRYKIK
jgi:hypothetical protein